jgi:hypothetical protein
MPAASRVFASRRRIRFTMPNTRKRVTGVIPSFAAAPGAAACMVADGKITHGTDYAVTILLGLPTAYRLPARDRVPPRPGRRYRRAYRTTSAARCPCPARSPCH